MLVLVCASAWAQSGTSETSSKNDGEKKKPVVKDNDAKDNPSKEDPGKNKNGKNKPGALVTPEREAAVKTFVKQHHAELAELLVQLKASNAKDYEQAIRELFRTSERLAQIQERDMDQYELELKLWQSQSRVQLLSARVKMFATKELREQLKAALNEQVDARVALLKREREKVSHRIGEIDDQLKKMEGNRKQIVDRQIENLAGSEKPAAKPPTPSSNSPAGS